MFMQLHRDCDPFYTSYQRYDPFHQLRRLQREMDDILSPALYALQYMPPQTVKNQLGDKDKFQVNLDVKNFAPEELSVKMVDNYLVIEAKHEEKQDEHGFVSRQFQRRYLIPENVNSELLNVNLSSDGILSVSAPKMIEQPKENEKSLPINITGQPALQNQNNKNEEAAEQKTKTESTPHGENRAEMGKA